MTIVTSMAILISNQKRRFQMCGIFVLIFQSQKNRDLDIQNDDTSASLEYIRENYMIYRILMM